MRVAFAVPFGTLILSVLGLCPVGDASATARSGTPVPFRLAGESDAHRGGSILIPAYVEGEGPFPFLLDTGSSRTMISESLAERLDLGSSGSSKGRSAHGTHRVQDAWIKSMEVGDARSRYLRVGVSPAFDRMLSGALGEPLGGAVGFNFLSDYEMTIDFARSEVTFRRPLEGLGDPDLTSTGPGIPFRLADPPDHPMILVRARIEGAGPYTFVLDTGASLSVLSPHVARELGVELGGDAPVPNVPDARFAEIEHIEVGGEVTSDLQVIVGELLEPFSRAAGEELHGILGYNYLCRFIVTLDYPNTTLRLAALPSPRMPWSEAH